MLYFVFFVEMETPVVVVEKSACTEPVYFADIRVYLDFTAHTKDFRYRRSTIPMISVLATSGIVCAAFKILPDVYGA